MSDTKETILDAVLEEVATGGLAELTLKAVAARADISIGLLSYHYRSKAELLRAVAERWQRRLAAAEAACWAAFSGEESVSDGLYRAVEEALNFARLHPAELRLMMRYVVIEGSLPEEMAATSLPLARQTAQRASQIFGVTELRARAVFHQAAILITRLALVSDAELVALYGLDDDDAQSSDALWARCRHHAATTVVNSLMKA